MNETAHIKLRSFMDAPDGWGRDQGRKVNQALLDHVEDNPGAMVFRVSVDGVKRVDISFASETIVELARRYRGSKGFCFIEMLDADMTENWDAAAARKTQPLLTWSRGKGRVLGVRPSQGTLAAFEFAMDRPRVRAAEFAAATRGMSIANASTKFKQLWELGFLLRREDVAESGGVEYSYYRIG
jgi:hypothetical protein